MDDSLVVTELSGDGSFLKVLLLLVVAGRLTRRDFDLVVVVAFVLIVTSVLACLVAATLGSRGVLPRTTYW